MEQTAVVALVVGCLAVGAVVTVLAVAAVPRGASLAGCPPGSWSSASEVVPAVAGVTALGVYQTGPLSLGWSLCVISSGPAEVFLLNPGQCTTYTGGGAPHYGGPPPTYQWSSGVVGSLTEFVVTPSTPTGAWCELFYNPGSSEINVSWSSTVTAFP